MQTFLPYPSYEESAAVLDDKRLGKQRVEALQIMLALVERTGWIHHPATKMWRGYEFSLLYYQYAMCWEWHIVRGFDDACLRTTAKIFWSYQHLLGNYVLDMVAVPPWWLGDEEFHLSHQSNLVRKDPEYYGKIFPGVPDNYQYVWPSHELLAQKTITTIEALAT